MGVPKFYRWLSERYPCLSEVISDGQVPEYDNLYFDMNGIIHNCSHPDDEDVSFRISEEEVFRDISFYIEALFGIIRPKKVFFMAIDGVAPRAKMNQQRARRFMSAKNAEDALKIAKMKGVEIPDEERFDSNCITPGTPFMARLHAYLQYFVQYKITTDTTWQGIRIYLSGHDCPGEGEHKIMDFIRSERSKAGYDPNTKHCLYGLDADLIMLGACSHEPHFSLLREEVQFGRKNIRSKSKKAGVDGITFHLLHISLLREYLGLEFQKLKEVLPFKYDVEAIIDDWVLMGFLVGNDFVPHLPYVHIHQDGLDALYNTYKEVLPQLDGYINENGVLNLRRFEFFLKAFAKNDRRCFFDEMDDINFLKSKRAESGKAFKSKRAMEKERQELIPFEMSDVEETFEGPSALEIEPRGAFDSDTDEEETDQRNVEDIFTSDTGGGIRPEFLLSASEAFEGKLADLESTYDGDIAEFPDENFENIFDLGWTRSVNRAFKDHKRDYYSEKMKYKNISKEQLRDQAEGYVRAIQWNLHYYYHGCCSWNWYYPHHYAPYISDVVDFSEMKLDFELSEPFHPFEQLLAVLPAASASCLPLPFQELMLDEKSPIYDFYPRNFLTDLNGKKNDWEAVVLIPFIDEKRLLDAMATKEHRLLPEERFRNSHGPHLLFTSDLENPTYLKSSFPSLVADIPRCIAKKVEVPMNEFRIERSRIVHGLLPGVLLDVYFPGFPTMKNIPHMADLRHADICVFRQPTLKKSIVLSILERPEFAKDISEIAVQLLGKEVLVEWPILKEGLVHQLWTSDAREFKRYGIDVGKRKAIVFVRPLLGISYMVLPKKVVAQKQWAKEDETKIHSLPLVVERTHIVASTSSRISSVEEAFPIGSTAFFSTTSTKFYGYRVEIESIEIPKKQSMLKVCCQLLVNDVDLNYLISNMKRYSLSWLHAYEVARRTSLSKNLINRITGYIPLYLSSPSRNGARQNFDEKINIGLDIKNTKKNLAILDYARRSDDGWEYSFNLVRIILEYRKRFPELLRHMEQTIKMNESYCADNIWSIPDEKAKRLNELRDFLKSTPIASLKLEPADGTYLDGNIIKEIDRTVEERPATWKTKHLGVKPYMLFRHELHTGETVPDHAEYELFDRVVCVRPLRGAPFGKIGTVVGLTGSKEKRFVEVLFDDCYSEGKAIRGSKKSACSLPLHALINITYGKRVRNEVQSSKVVKASNSEKLTFWAPTHNQSNARKSSLPAVNSEDTKILTKSYMPSSNAKKETQKIRLLKKETPGPKQPVWELFEKNRKEPVSETALQKTQMPVRNSSRVQEDAVKDPKTKSISSSSFGAPGELGFLPSKLQDKQDNERKEKLGSKAFGEYQLDDKDSEHRFNELLSKLKLGSERLVTNNVQSSSENKHFENESNLVLEKQENVSTTPISACSSSANIAIKKYIPSVKTAEKRKGFKNAEEISLTTEQLPFSPDYNGFASPLSQFDPSGIQSQMQHTNLYSDQSQKQYDSSVRFKLRPSVRNSVMQYLSESQPQPPFGGVMFPNVYRPPSYNSPFNWPMETPNWETPLVQGPLAPNLMHVAKPSPSSRCGTSAVLVPSNMTPTQVIRKKKVKSLETKQNKPNFASLSSNNDAEGGKDQETVSSVEQLGNAEFVFSETKDDPVLQEIASEIPKDIEKLLNSTADTSKSSLPEFDSLPELRVTDAALPVLHSALSDLNGDPKIPSTDASEINLRTPKSEGLNNSPSLSEKAEFTEASKKPKFKVLSARKCRLAVKFN